MVLNFDANCSSVCKRGAPGCAAYRIQYVSANGDQLFKLRFTDRKTYVLTDHPFALADQVTQVSPVPLVPS